MASPEYWLLTVPNRGDAVEVTLNKMARGTAAHRAEAPQNPHRVDVPNLVVGTLDSLMALRSVRACVRFGKCGWVPESLNACPPVHTSIFPHLLRSPCTICTIVTTCPRWTSRSRRW